MFTSEVTHHIRFISRFLGLWFLAAAFIFLVYDGAGWVANGVAQQREGRNTVGLNSPE